MMMFKTFGYIVMTQALYFCQDLKLGHYMHVPQRSLFTAQLVATIWSCFCQLATVEWAMGAIKGVCTKAATGNFTCAYIKTFYNASVIWGAIGPKHLFSSGAVYTSLQYFWLAGFLSPFVIYGLARVFPRVSMIRKVSMPLIFGAFAYVPPYSAMNIVSCLCTLDNHIIILTCKPAVLGRYRLHLQQVHPQQVPWLVDGVQLHYFCSPGCRSCHLRHHPLLLRPASWCFNARLVGHPYHLAGHS
jgi:OPT family oligopeptide transporter